MRTKHRGRERSPAASTRQSADRRRGGDEYPHGGGGGNGGGRVLPAAYMTARDTARTLERGSDGSESDTMKTGRDMHTARGFETDDYISAAEQLSCRGSTGIFWKDDALRSRGGAPAFGPSSHQHYKHSMPMPGQIFPGRFERRRDIDEITISRCCNVGGSGEQVDIQQSASVPQQKRCGSLEGCQRRSSSRSGPSVVQRRSGTYSTAAGLRQAVGKQVDGTSTEYGGSGNSQLGGFRQSMVEDIFSYARHNRVEDLERMMDQGVPADVRDSHGNTVLIVACQNGHKRALKAALRHGADPNVVNTRGNTALHYCYAFGYGGSLGRYLMEKGADSSIRNRSGLVCYDGIGR